jgi:hypothetical protein
MSTTHIDVSPDMKRVGRRFGYAVAVVVNLVMLVIVQNVLDWGWPPFLTDDFTQVVPWISFSLVVSILANVVYQFNDDPTVKSTGQIGVNLISILVTYQMWQVFPFDFSAYQFDWAIVVRVLLILAMVGSGIGAVTEAMRLARGASRKRR